MRNGQVSLYIIIGIIVVVVSSVAMYINSTQVEPTVTDIETVTPTEPSTGGEPSTSEVAKPPPKPKPVVSGLKYTPGVNRLQVFIVPINYAPDDPELLTRVADYLEFMMDETNLSLGQFFIVPEPFNHAKRECPDANLVRNFVDDWHQRNFALALPGREMHAKVPSHRYRVVGIDSWQGSLASCGCGYTNDIYGPSSYIGGGKCSKKPEAMAHEIGHSFGMCDEYDTCTWEETSDSLKRIRGVPCLNSRPTENNSICGNNCCSNITACCIGKYAETKEDNAYNMMGAVGSPVKYRLSIESRSHISKYLCKWLQVCGVSK